MVSQAVLMLSSKWEAGDVKKLAQAFLFGLFGMLPGKHEHDYNVWFHLFMSCAIAAFTFVYRFRDKLVVRVSGQSLLVWNLLFLVVLFNHFGLSPVVGCLVAIPTLLTLSNGFMEYDESFGWQVFFHSWFSVMIVSIGLLHFSFTALSIFFPTNQAISLPPLEVYIAGASFLYLLVNIWYVIALIPVSMRKGQSFEDRMIEVRALMQLIESGYIWQSNAVLINLFLIIVLPMCFYANYYFQYFTEGTVISLTLIGVLGLGKFDVVRKKPISMFTPTDMRAR
jgi:hypothetical protein